jgi:GH24 family phage-related lysozyme (muramidase)
MMLVGQDSISSPRHTTDRKGQVLPGLVARRRLEQALIAVSAEAA